MGCSPGDTPPFGSSVCRSHSRKGFALGAVLAAEFTANHSGLLTILVVNTKERSVIVSKLSPEIFPEYILIRTNKFDKIAVTPLEEWMDYLKRGTIRPDTMTPGLGEAREKLRYYSMTPEDRYAYDEHLNAVMIQNDVLDSAKLEGYLEGLAESRAENKEKGKAKGLAKGETEANLENAKKMKAMGIDLEMIRQITGITL